MSQSGLDTKTIEFDATHSWNGYSYQGKVALIVVLEVIIDLIKRGDSPEPFNLEFELIEDFSILKDDKYIQIHQVKSYGPESLSKYRDAVWLLFGKSVYEEYSTISKSYLHAAEVITSNKGEINSTKKLIEVINTYEKPSSSKSNKLASPLDLYEYVDEKGLKEEAFKKFEIYTYSDGKKYCSLFDIQEKVKEKILEYYTCVGKKESLDSKGILNRQLEISYNFLLGLIDTHINERHINRQTESEKFLREIKFTKFIEILDKEYEKLPKSYYVYYLKNKLVDIFNEYYASQKIWLKDQVDSSNNDPEIIKECGDVEEGLEKIMTILKNIYSNLSDDEFLLFCNRISPQLKINRQNGLLFNELVNSEFIKFPWIETLLAFKEELNLENLLIKLDKQYYLASTINHTINIPGHLSGFKRQRANALIEATISDIAKNIIENRDIYKELYMIDNIITGNINAQLKDYIHRVTDYKTADVEKEGYHIMDIKNVELIDLENSLKRRGNNE